MSRETSEWLNQNVLIGFTSKRGNAWHYRAASQGEESNHYEDAVPVADVHRRLFNWSAVKVRTADDVSSILYSEAERKADPAKRKPMWNESAGNFRIIRSDTLKPLGSFREGYQVHSFGDWLLNNVATLLDAGLQVGSAGLLRGGKQAWVSVEVPDTIRTPEGVDFRPNLLACSSHDGSIATTYKRVATMIVCDNTLAAGLSEKGQVFKFKHTRDSINKVADAREALSIIHEAAADFENEVRTLCQTTVSDSQWRLFLDAHTPLPEDKGRGRTMAENKRGELHRLWTSDNRVSPWQNTAFGVLQAVNTYTHHIGQVKNMSRPERNMARAVDGEIDKLDTETIRVLDKVLARA